MTPRAVTVASILVFASLLVARPALAQRSHATSLTVDAGASTSSSESVDAGPADGIAALTHEIDALRAELGQQLSTHACDEACRALASMRRAAERLCALDSGSRCVEARGRCDGAAAQVRAVCPECAIAASATKAERTSTGATDSPAKEPTLAGESRHGGCASCSTVGATPDLGDATVLGVGLALTAAVARRRRYRARPGSSPQP